MAPSLPDIKKVPKWALITAGAVTVGAVGVKIFRNSPAGEAVDSSGSETVTDLSTGSGFQYGSGSAAGVIVPPVIMGGSDTSGSTDNAASLIDSIQTGNANILISQGAAYQGIFSDYSSNLGGIVGSAFSFAGGAVDSALGLAQGTLDTASGIINAQGNTITGLAGANVDAINASTGLVNSAAGVLDSGGNLINATAGAVSAQGAANAGVLSGVQGILATMNAGPPAVAQAQNPSPINVVLPPGQPAAPAQASTCGGDYPNSGPDGGCYKVVCASGRGDAAKGRWHYYRDGRKLHVRDTC